jgi:hypothetical protein
VMTFDAGLRAAGRARSERRARSSVRCAPLRGAHAAPSVRGRVRVWG